MRIFNSLAREKNENMSDLSYRAMSFVFKLMDIFGSGVGKRIRTFNIKPGMTVVDYGCGPGRYTTAIAGLAGDKGKVYAVDLQRLAIVEVQKKTVKLGLKNVETVLADGYSSSVPDHTADVVCALDMFFGVSNPEAFLAEIKRIIKKDGVLIIDDGHQPRAETKRKIAAAGMWDIVEETPDHLKCKIKV